jgi:hypothetical protein
MAHSTDAGVNPDHGAMTRAARGPRPRGLGWRNVAGWALTNRYPSTRLRSLDCWRTCIRDPEATDPVNVPFV